MTSGCQQKKCTLTKVYCIVVSTTVMSWLPSQSRDQPAKLVCKKRMITIIKYEEFNVHVFDLRCMFFKSGSFNAYNDPTTKFMFF